MGLIKATEHGRKFQSNYHHPDRCFKPFILKGSNFTDLESKRSATCENTERHGASQSIIREVILPFSEESFCQSSVIVQGVELGSPRFALTIKGIDFILGNDCTGGKVMTVPEVLDRPNPSLESTSAQDQPL